MKVAIIGAGPAGLAAAWELKTLGVAVDVFEGHSKPGGSASYFRRPIPHENAKALFDAGATVLWSFKEGDFYHSLLKRWRVKTSPFSTHPFHRFDISNRSFELDARNEESWIQSLLRAFPKDKEFITKNFPRFFNTARTLNSILYKVPATPFLSLKTLVENKKIMPELLGLSKDFLCLPRSFAELIQNTSDEFKEWANSLLLISLQAKAPEVESLYGIAALCFFPLGAGSLQGGMASLFDALTQQLPTENARIFMRENVSRISYDKGYTLETKNNSYQGYSHVLLTCPRWNSQELFDQKLFEASQLPAWNQIKGRLWTAVVNYLIYKDNPALPHSAFNHLVKNEKGEFYFSVSARGDNLRAPAGYRVVTASTHEKLDQWNYATYLKKKDFPGRVIYEAQKKKWEESFHEAANKVFSETPVFSEIGSPQTFHAYTQRREGFVGGIPLSREFSLLKSPTQDTLLPNVYQIGDTSFPGQSVVNCAVGALEGVRKVIASGD